jgi:hypothetical protein
MADILVDNEALPSTPASGKSVLLVDTTSKKFCQLDDSGRPNGILSRNDATASQGALATTDTYITNSGILVPSFGMKVGQLYEWVITLSKTAAGTAAFVLNVRLGNAQSTGDTSILALTQAIAQTATASSAIMHVVMGVRSVSATGVVAGAFAFSSVSAFGDGKDGASATFNNSAVGGQFMGLSFTTGASAAWTLTHVSGRLVG